MYYVTSDEHYGHEKIIEYCQRPFKDAKDMDEELIKRFNSVVTEKDITIHAGDFTLKAPSVAADITHKLNGKHIFINGSHDYWMKAVGNTHEMWQKNCFHELTKRKYHITVCHYCLREWPRSHYNSWHLYGHSHGRLPSIGKSLDIGVDSHNFYPWSLDEIVEVMRKKPNNPNRYRGRQ